MWNVLDVRVAWVAELAEIWHTVPGEEAVDAIRHAPGLGSAFVPVDAITFDWADTMPVVDLAELVTTRSYYLNASEQIQATGQGPGHRLHRCAVQYDALKAVELGEREYLARREAAKQS